MRGLTLDFGDRRLRERELPEPAIEQDDQVLFRVAEVGVCGTDRLLARFELGRPPAGADYLVLGHEAIGQVTRVGSGVTGLGAGDWVVPMVRRPCVPACFSCGRGRRDLCVSGRYTERGIVAEHGYFAELAVDRERDLVLVPAGLAEVAVLLEPLSVAEKAIDTALRLHEGEPRRALVLGAGAIGMLTAMALRLRGFEVTVQSLEGPDNTRARLLESAGIAYRQQAEGVFDVVLEAAGSGDAALAGLGMLGPLGVLVVIGALRGTGEIPFQQLILRNQRIAGVVNSSPEAFEAAVKDLGRMDEKVLGTMIERARFADYARTLTGPLGDAPKQVHVMS